MALRAISERSEAQKRTETEMRYRRDLSESDLSFINLRGYDFSAANLQNCRIVGTFLDWAVLNGSLMQKTVLDYSTFANADLTGARLDYAIIRRPEPSMHGFTRSINLANLKGVTLVGADISAIEYIGDAKKISEIFGCEDTILSEPVSQLLPSKGDRTTAILISATARPPSADDLEAIQRVEKSGFVNWPPFHEHDIALPGLVEKFRNSLGLTDWPYV